MFAQPFPLAHRACWQEVISCQTRIFPLPSIAHPTEAFPGLLWGSVSQGQRPSWQKIKNYFKKCKCSIILYFPKLLNMQNDKDNNTLHSLKY